MTREEFISENTAAQTRERINVFKVIARVEAPSRFFGDSPVVGGENWAGSGYTVAVYPYVNETWEEIADHQFDHDPTPEQAYLHAAIADLWPES